MKVARHHAVLAPLCAVAIIFFTGCPAMLGAATLRVVNNSQNPIVGVFVYPPTNAFPSTNMIYDPILHGDTVKLPILFAGENNVLLFFDLDGEAEPGPLTVQEFLDNANTRGYILLQYSDADETTHPIDVPKGSRVTITATDVIETTQLDYVID